MSDHNPDVVAVMVAEMGPDVWTGAERLAKDLLIALSHAGYAVVAHGARLVASVLPAHPVLYRIHEDTP